jgi:hypothetical protein
MIGHEIDETIISDRLYIARDLPGVDAARLQVASQYEQCNLLSAGFHLICDCRAGNGALNSIFDQ